MSVMVSSRWWKISCLLKLFQFSRDNGIDKVEQRLVETQVLALFGARGRQGRTMASGLTKYNAGCN